MKRGEIYYIESNNREVGHEQWAGRPAVIVSADAVNNTSGVVNVVYMTTQPKYDSPTHVTTRSTGRVSTILCEQCTSVSKTRVHDYVGKLTDSELQAVDAALMVSLGLDPYIAEPTEEAPEEKTTTNNYVIHASDDSRVLVAVLETERDVYKRLYEELQERILNGGRG